VNVSKCLEVLLENFKLLRQATEIILNFSSPNLQTKKIVQFVQKIFAFGRGKRGQIVCWEKCDEHFCVQNNRAFVRGN